MMILREDLLSSIRYHPSWTAVHLPFFSSHGPYVPICYRDPVTGLYHANVDNSISINNLTSVGSKILISYTPPREDFYKRILGRNYYTGHKH